MWIEIYGSTSIYTDIYFFAFLHASESMSSPHTFNPNPKQHYRIHSSFIFFILFTYLFIADTQGHSLCFSPLTLTSSFPSVRNCACYPRHIYLLDGGLRVKPALHHHQNPAPPPQLFSLLLSLHCLSPRMVLR